MPALESSSSSLPRPGRKLRVLIVAEAAEPLSELIRSLGSRGYPVVGAATMAEGEEVARRYTYDVLVVSLPSEVATAFLGRVRRRRPAVRAVLVDVAEGRGAVRGTPDGFVGRVGRPVGGEALESAVESAMAAAVPPARFGGDLLFTLPTEGPLPPPLVFKPWPNFLV